MPGEQMDLHVYYFPLETKVHHLKIFFSILNGKPLVMNFMGETLARKPHL